MANKKDTVLEKDILNDICETLKKKDLLFWRSNNIPVFGRSNDGNFRFRAMPKFSRKGVPDILVISKGKFIGIEVKREGKKLRPDQVSFADELIQHGGHYLVVHSLCEFISTSVYSELDKR